MGLWPCKAVVCESGHLGLGLLPPVLSHSPHPQILGFTGRGWSPVCPQEESPGPGQGAPGPGGLGGKRVAPHYRPAAPCKDHCLPQTSRAL